MKVFFDGKIFSSQSPGGISRVIFELINSFSQIEGLERIFYRGLYADQYPFEREWFKKYYGFRKSANCKYRFINLLDNMGMEIAYSLNASPDLIYHSSLYRIPKRPQGPVVVHVYDMIHELFYNNLKVKRFKKKSFETADLIVSISESTKKDLCKLYPIDPNKVIIAYPGVSSPFHSSIAGGDNKRPYMLYVGARNYLYKNFDLLLNTFLEQKYFLDFDLIIVGGEKNLTAQQQKRVSNTIGKGSWLKQEFCKDERLAELYSNASVFIYPSIYEGFGIPLIEAMACECPIVASNIPSTLEVVGSVALLFNPEDPKSLFKQIDRIISDRFMSNQLVKRGKIRAQQFTWEHMADTIYKGYLKLL